MAVNVVCSLFIVPLFFTQIVQSHISLHYCTFKEGSKCVTNIPIDQTDRILKIKDTYGLHMNLTCASTQAIHWVIHIPPEFRIEGPDPIITAQTQSNSSTLTYNLNAQVPLFKLKGSIQCEACNNSEEYAEVFISTGTSFSLMGKYDALNFFIPNPNGPVVIPCAGTFVPGNETVKLLKTAANNKVINSVSDECLKCICHPFHQCNKPRACTPSSAGCGYFAIGKDYWMTAGQPLAANLTTHGDLHQDWHSCVLDYNCSVETVRKHMWKVGRDCNQDDVITCEDYILIHRYGQTGCLRYKEHRDGGSKLLEHQPCLKAMTTEEDITENATYEQSMGFVLNGTLDSNALYICSSSLRDVQYTFVPLDDTHRVPSQMHFNHSDGPAKEMTISCTVGTKPLESLKLIAASCQSLTQCDLKFRPYNDLGKIEGEARTGLARKSNRHIVTTRLPFTEGIVGCIGLDNNTSNVFKYVRHFDYFFTGLDSQPYFLSSKFPSSAVLRFEAGFTNGTQENIPSQKFTCRVSTFLVLPVFQFAFHYSDSTVQLLPLNSALTPDAVATEFGRLSIIRRQASDAERSLELKPSPAMTHISCRVRLVNSNEWINETLPIPVRYSDTGVTSVVTAIAALCMVLILSAVVGVLLARMKLQTEPLTEDEMQQFLEGDPTIPEGTAAENANDNGYELSIDRMRFPQDFMLSSELYLIDKRQELGSGEFGRCYKGTLNLNGRNIDVAIKMLKNTRDKEYFMNFLKEIKVMAYVGQHENVVKFYGAMVDRIAKRECHVLMELSRHGNLRTYLSQLCVNFVAGPDTTGSNHVKSTDYVAVQLTQFNLISFCKQIAAGMEYIASKRIVHGDLAARNVLVFPNFVVKITDFGLARKLYRSGVYRSGRQVPLPWRWMAPESLKSLEFSTASDVWSFGITAWEILSHGCVPFADLQLPEQLLKFVANGDFLPRPEYATEEMYNFLKRCWSRASADRPSFSDAKAFFSDPVANGSCKYSRIVPVEALPEGTSMMYTSVC